MSVPAQPAHAAQPRARCWPAWCAPLPCVPCPIGCGFPSALGAATSKSRPSSCRYQLTSGEREPCEPYSVRARARGAAWPARHRARLPPRRGCAGLAAAHARWRTAAAGDARLAASCILAAAAAGARAPSALLAGQGLKMIAWNVPVGSGVASASDTRLLGVAAVICLHLSACCQVGRLRCPLARRPARPFGGVPFHNRFSIPPSRFWLPRVLAGGACTQARFCASRIAARRPVVASRRARHRRGCGRTPARRAGVLLAVQATPAAPPLAACGHHGRTARSALGARVPGHPAWYPRACAPGSCGARAGLAPLSSG